MSEKKSDKRPADNKGKPSQTSDKKQASQSTEATPIREPRPVVESSTFNPNTGLHKVTVSFYLKDLPKKSDIHQCIRGCHNELEMATSKGKLILGGSGGSSREIGKVASKSAWSKTVSQNLKKATDSLIKPFKSASKELAKPLKTVNLDESLGTFGWSTKRSRSFKVGSTALGDCKLGGKNDEGTSQKYKFGKFNILSKFKKQGSSSSGQGTRSSGIDEMKKDDGLQKNSTLFARSQSVSVASNPRPFVPQRNSLPDMPPRASLVRTSSASTLGSARAQSPELRRNRSSPADAPPRRRRRLIADEDDSDEAKD